MNKIGKLLIIYFLVSLFENIRDTRDNGDKWDKFERKIAFGNL
jgi:hypothetical protein